MFDFATPWTVACRAPLSTEIPRQEYWSGLPFSSPGDRPQPGMEPRSSALAAAAAAESLQSCPTLCDPIDGSPPGSPVPGILQARTLEWVVISFSNAWKWKVKVKSLSHVWLVVTPWTAAHQAPPSMGFSRRESWSGVPLPSPSALARGFFTPEPFGKLVSNYIWWQTRDSVKHVSSFRPLGTSPWSQSLLWLVNVMNS